MSASRAACRRRAFPTASAPWARPGIRSWSERVGEALGREARAQGWRWCSGPGINIKRSPLCGRNFEYLSEDPVLSGVLGAAMVEGIQSQGVGASLKHFAANNQETDRLRVSAEVDERTLREIYLAGFERVVTQARPWTVMCAYNRINGVLRLAAPLAAHRRAAGRVGLRRPGRLRLGRGARPGRRPRRRPGPGDATEPRRQRRRASSRPSATAASTRACSTRPCSRVLAAGRPGRRTTEPPTAFDADAHHALARAAAAECAVLLKNDDAILPLQPGRRRRDRGDRRVRPHAALPGRRQLPGQPDRVDVAAGRAARRCPRPGGGGVRRRVRRRHHRRRRRSWPPRRSRWPDGPTRSWSSSACPPRPSPRGSTAATWTCRPTRSALLAAARGRQPERRRGAGQRLGGAAVALGAPRQGDPGVLAVRPGRRRRGRRPAARRGEPFRPAGRDPAAAAGGQPVVPELPR